MSPASRSRPDELAGLVTLLRALLYKRWLLLVRYPVNTFGQLVTAYLFFAILFFGGRAMAGRYGGVGSFGDTFDSLIVGWFLWTMALAAYFSLVSTATDESQWGTLEQLYMSPYGFGAVMAGVVVTYVIESLVWGAIILPLMLVTTGRHLSIDLLTIAPISVFSLLSVVGISFVFGGLALLYKRIQNVTQLVQFLLVGFIAAPTASQPVLRYLPLVQGSAMLQAAMNRGTRLWEFSTADVALLVAAGVGYCLLGYYVFRACERLARKRGVMGHY